MRKTSVVIATVTALVLSATAAAGEAKIQFKKVDDYTDFRPASGIKERFQERQMEALTEYFDELSQQLPKGQILNVTITDIDLTGRLEPTFGESAASFIRVVRSIDFPTMELSYQLLDADGNVVKEEQTKLKDMGFDFGNLSSRRSQTDDLYYEKKMLKDWFRKTFSEHVSTNPPGESV